MRALPDPIFTNDSIDYLQPVFSLLSRGRFELDSVRTPGYPILLVSLLGSTHSFFPVLVLQHTLSLATAVITAFLFYYFVKKSAAWSLGLCFLISVLPQEVAYGQILLTETLYSFWVILFIGSLLWGLRDPHTSAWAWVGAMTSLAMLTRPVGWALFMTALIMLFLFHKGSVRRRSLCLFFLPVLVLMGSYGVYNRFARDFYGFDQMGGVVFFDTTAQFLDLEKIPDADLRNFLTPVWEKHRRDIEDPNWVFGSKESPVQVFLHDERSKKRAMSVMMALGIHAMREHPLLFLRIQLRLFSYFFREGSIPYIRPKGEALYVFGRALFLVPAVRDWLVFRPATARAYFDHVLHTPAYPYQATTFLTRQLRFLPEVVEWLPLSAVLACLMLYRRRELYPFVGCLLTLIVIHIGLTNLARGVESEVRYAIPIEPLYCMLLFAGLGGLADGR